MAITKLVSFAGEAEILGQTHYFNQDGANGILVIHGVKDHVHAMAILDRLSLGTLAAVATSEILAAPKDKAKNGAGAVASDAVAQSYAKPEVAAAPTKPEPKKAKAPRQPPVEDHQGESSPPATAETMKAPVEPGPAGGDSLPTPSLKLVEPVPGALADKAVAAAHAEIAEEEELKRLRLSQDFPAMVAEQLNKNLPQEVIAAKRMLPIVTYFREKGFMTVAEIVRACEAVKPQVPILQRVLDLPDRVERTLAGFFPPTEEPPVAS